MRDESGVNIYKEAKARLTRAFIEYEFGHPEAKWLGDDYQTVSPLRKDDNPGSFSINIEKACYFDRATQESGDIIDLLSKRDGVSPYEAACYVLGRPAYPDEGGKSSEPTPRQNQPQPEKPAPEDEGKPSEEKIEISWLPIPNGKKPDFKRTPDDLTLYHVNGEPAYYVARYNAHGDQRKTVYPLYWTGSTFKAGLTSDLKRHRVFVQFDPGKTVVVVEGELKRRLAEDAFPEYSWTCWHGGAPAAKYVDASCFKGCDVVVWPDFDEPGALAADAVCSRIIKHAKKVRRIVPPMGKPRGWDVANAIEDGFNVLAAIEGAGDIEETHADEVIQTITEPHLSMKRPFTDLGNAERFLDMWGHVLRYNVDRGRWLVWDNTKWNDEDQTLVTAMVKRTIRSIPLTDDVEGAYQWSIKSESSRGISSLLSLAKNEPGVPISETQLDYMPYYLCCPNGVIDLTNGELLNPRPDWLCYKITNTKYTPHAPCPNFMKFLDETFQEDPGLINFVQRWFGYSLTTDVSAQLFTVFYGLGANGKSTLVETIQKVMGTYVKTAPPDTFIQKQAGGIPNDIAALRGARTVLTTETEANARLAEAKVKSMTGGDRVSARYMRGEFFEFTPTWKITISTNHRPRISGGDYGIWRRVVLVPFNNIVPVPKQDPKLMEKLWAEAEGILAWVVAGAVAWYKSGGGRVGLQVPERVFEETQEYREDEDVIGRFISMACHTGEEVHSLVSSGKLIRPGSPCSHVFYSFKAWAEEEGETNYVNISQNAFGRAMRERGFLPERTANERYYQLIVPRDKYMRRGEYSSSVNSRED